MTKAIHVSASKVADRFIARGVRPGADVGFPHVRAAELAEYQGVRIGLWECGQGGWPVPSRGDFELCLVLGGTATITDADSDTSFAVAAGDLLVLPVGWSGRWDVSDSIRKLFISLPDGADITVS